MKYQQVTVDVWKMTVTAVSYLALAFAAWVLLRLVSACVTLPAYLRKQQEEEEAEERRLLLEMEDEEEEEEEEEEGGSSVDEEDGDDDKEGGDRPSEGGTEAARGSVEDDVVVPPTPRAGGRGRRRVTLKTGDEAPAEAPPAQKAADKRDTSADKTGGGDADKDEKNQMKKVK